MKNYTIAIFGSSLRTDFDKYSDKDLLIIADNFKILENLKKEYSNKGWSISYYTYSKLEYLAKKGSLFVKHLQNESKIIIDKNGSFEKILRDFNLKKSYQTDVNNSMCYFEILKSIPKSNLGFAWFCDSFFVGLRNYLVFKNADNDIFEFSYTKLIEILRNEKLIDDSDIKALKELRVVKRNYRENIIDELPSIDFVQKIISIGRKIGVIKSVKILEPISFQNRVEENILNENFDSYQRLRLVEGYYSSQQVDIPELKKIISNPQFYASKMKDNDFTMELISEIKKHHTTNAKNHFGCIPRVCNVDGFKPHKIF